MKNIAVMVFALAFVSACSVSYQPPESGSVHFTAPHKSDQATIFTKLKKTLLQDGFEIESSLEEQGVLTTRPKRWKLKPEEVNCGRILALDYLYDNRTTTDVAFNIKVDATTLSIRTKVLGQYKPGDLDEAIELTCVSHLGFLEEDLANKVLAAK